MLLPLSQLLQALNFICPILIALRTVIGLTNAVIPLPIAKPIVSLLENVFPRYWLYSTSLSLILVVYLSVATFGGLASFEFLKNVRPRPGETSIHVIILNIYLLVLLAASIPIVANILGTMGGSMQFIYSSVMIYSLISTDILIS